MAGKAAARGWRLFVLAGFGLLVFLGPSTSALAASPITEFTAGLKASSRPGQIVVGPDGNLWFTDPGAGVIGKITPSGSITEYTAGLNADSQPREIITGPDGNLWFTDAPDEEEAGTPAIGRITPTGTITEFSTGVNQEGAAIDLREPNGIVVGPDGNLWFTDSAGFFSTNKSGVGKITPGGSITEYELPLACTMPGNILSGPDGNLWFVSGAKSPFCGGIGTITPSGTITEFEATFNSSAGAPRWLTLGPDGNLWFTSTRGINRITTGGVITTYTANLPTELNLGRIITGPDGNLWFADSEHIGGSSAIGRVTPTGTITEFPVADPHHNRISSIVTGPDGNLWFTDQDNEAEPGSSAIGRMSTSGQVTLFSFGLTERSRPSALVVGPGGSNLWFTDSAPQSGAIGRIAPVGPAGVSPDPTLTITLVGNGSVSTTPGGINCGPTCDSEFSTGNLVTLAATPAPGYSFQGWNTNGNGCEFGSCPLWAAHEGERCSGTAPCGFTIRGDTQISAVFAPATTGGPANDGENTQQPSSSEQPTATKAIHKKPRKCRKGFKKRRVHGKVKCVKTRKRHSKKPRSSGANNPSRLLARPYSGH